MIRHPGLIDHLIDLPGPVNVKRVGDRKDQKPVIRAKYLHGMLCWYVSVPFVKVDPSHTDLSCRVIFRSIRIICFYQDTVRIAEHLLQLSQKQRPIAMIPVFRDHGKIVKQKIIVSGNRLFQKEGIPGELVVTIQPVTLVHVTVQHLFDRRKRHQFINRKIPSQMSGIYRFNVINVVDPFYLCIHLRKNSRTA